MHSESKDVLAFRLERMKNAPSNWMYWFALFCILNGVFIANGEDITLLAGLIFPYAFQSTIFHYIFGVFFVFIGYFSKNKIPSLIYIGLGLYILDMLYSFAIGITSGGIIHAIILALISFSFFRTKSLSKQLTAINDIKLSDESNKDAVI